jgi:hypothetical protein
MLGMLGAAAQRGARASVLCPKTDRRDENGHDGQPNNHSAAAATKMAMMGNPTTTAWRH